MCVRERIKKTKEKASDVVVDDWKDVFLTHSFWLTFASIILTVVSIILPYMGFLQPVLSTEAYGISMFVLNALAAFARFIKQKGLEE